MTQQQAFTLSQLNRRVAADLSADPYLQNVWVTAETVDVRVSGGHCYLELVEKDSNGKQLARARATIWASTYYDIASRFRAETGQQFRSDIKVMVRVTVNFHPVYGFSYNINAINSAYTLGDAMQRRLEILERLKADGVIEMNRQLPWPTLPQRIAVISAKGAAGYGDFINQLYNNPLHLRFATRLFPAVMQGERTVPSIIAALGQVADQAEAWDCVVIIRGGGGTSDLAAFDDYDLASHIAQFPIPVVIGIGHERDVTVLDYVANMRVKTPTAAAEWLISRNEQALAHLHSIAQAMLQAITDRLSGCHRQLSFIAGQLPAAAMAATVKAQKRLLNAQVGIASIADRKLRPQLAVLDNIASRMRQAADFAIDRAKQRLEADAAMLAALSPQATLARGYTITRVDGKAVCDPSQLAPGQVIETIMARGSVRSTITTTYNKE